MRTLGRRSNLQPEYIILPMPTSAAGNPRGRNYVCSDLRQCILWNWKCQYPIAAIYIHGQYHADTLPIDIDILMNVFILLYNMSQKVLSSSHRVQFFCKCPKGDDYLVVLIYQILLQSTESIHRTIATIYDPHSHNELMSVMLRWCEVKHDLCFHCNNCVVCVINNVKVVMLFHFCLRAKHRLFQTKMVHKPE